MSLARVLFIDADRFAIESYQRSLEHLRHDYDLVFESDSRIALARAVADSVDLIVSALDMPGMTGLELLTLVGESEKIRHVPVVLVAETADASLYDLAIESGAYDLLAKPVQRQAFQSTLRNATRLKRAEDERRAKTEEIETEVARRTEELYLSRLDILWRLGKAAEFRDEETGNHVVRVACYSRLIAQELDLPADFVENLFLAAPLHDVGKIAVPDHVLRKPGRLDASEWRSMYRHCEIGAAILDRDTRVAEVARRFGGRTTGDLPENPVLEMGRQIARYHHEKWDGTGYPKCLSGKDIPIAARIVAVADVYDALRSKRPYKKSLSVEESIDVITASSGSHFDPTVVQAFLNVIDAVKRVDAELVDSRSSGRFSAGDDSVGADQYPGLIRIDDSLMGGRGANKVAGTLRVPSATNDS